MWLLRLGLLVVAAASNNNCCNMPHVVNPTTYVNITLPVLNSSGIWHSRAVTLPSGWKVKGWERSNKWLAKARENTGIYEHDGGFSLREQLSPDSDYFLSLWTFGDTFLSHGGGLQNSALKLERLGNNITATFMSGTNGNASCIVPIVAPDGCSNGYHNWPAGGVVIGGTAHIYMSLIPPKGKGVQQGALFSTPLVFSTPMSFTQTVPPTTDLPQLYGVVQHADGWYYGYFFEEYGTGKNQQWGIYLARFQAIDVTNPTAYQYHTTGGAWSNTIRNKTHLNITISSMNPTMDVVYMKTMKLYVMVLTNFWKHALWLTTSPTPSGPWTAPVETYKQYTGQNPWYAAYFHPELGGEVKGGVSVYVTFSHGGKPGVPSLVELVFSKA